MKINQKIRYGVACLYELSKTPNEFMHTEEIAAKQTIPLAYAHKVLQSLSREGLVSSLKGTGYRLRRPLSEITAFDVIEAMSHDEASDTKDDLGALLEARINKALGSFTLHDLTATK